MMSHAEIVVAMARRFPGHFLLPTIVDIWRAQAAALLATQPANPADGRWHQVLNDSSTYLETSVTAMALYSIVIGVEGGWLDRATYAPLVEAAWAGVASQVRRLSARSVCGAL
jgi:rhamnogalacturonyl hydrolase YesR